MESENKKYTIVVIVIIVIGILVRVVNIDKLPDATNVDEISAGYEAFSILNYGIDRNGNFLPVFLKAWGGGQNALLSYLIVPFIKMFGLTVFTTRLPMAILGCISLFIIYYLLNKICNRKLALIGLAFFAICPWHVMKSRWGLESNLFPDLILIFVYLLIKGIEDKRLYFYLSFIIAGLAAYSYGTSYFFLPVFIIPVLIMLIKKKEIKMTEAVIGLGITTVVAMPIILYVIINTFDLGQINLPFMTVPKLDINRYQEVTSIFSKDFIKSTLDNLYEGIKVIILQDDHLPWNSTKYGIIYHFSIIFTLIGIVNCFKRKKWVEIKYNYIFNIWFIVCIFLMTISFPNINRLNIMWIPIIYYTIIGLYAIINLNYKVVISAIVIVYVTLFGLFLGEYSKQKSDGFSTFEGEVKEPIEYVSKIGNKEIYVTNEIKETYIYILFYTKYNTKDFINTVEYYNKGAEFEQVKSFGKYRIGKIKEITNANENVFIINKKDIEKYNINQEKWKIVEFNKYCVIQGIGE